MGKREAQIEKPLVKRIKAIGGEIRKAMWIGRRGCPDRFAMIPDRAKARLAMALGRRLAVQNPWIECKAEGEPLEDHQEREIARMRKHGELVLVIDSLEQIDRYFPLVPGDAEA